MSDHFLTPRQAAEVLQVKRSTLSRFRQERRGPSFTKVGRIVRYRRSDLEAWLDGHRVGTDDRTKPEAA